MRVGLWALLALLLGAFAAHFLLADRGYVLVNFRGYVVEMSVPGLVLVLVALYFSIRGVVALARLPRRLREGAAEQRIRRSGEALARGLIHITEGDWARGERLLTHGLKGSDAPLVNYLLAARAAQLQGAPERRDEWLKLAYEETPDGEAAVLLTQAELQLQSGEVDAAVATLERLGELRPDHPGALGLLARAYQARRDRPGLRALLPKLGRARVPDAVREELALDALRGELERPDLDAERVAAVWADVPSELRSSCALIALHALALQRVGSGEEAERVLRAALKRDWKAPLVTAFGEVRGADAAKQLKQAETWLKTYPEDAALLLSAARLAMANELWGKARSYLESSLALAPVPEAYALYGALLTEIGEGERAALAFRSGLLLVAPAAAQPLRARPSLEAPRPKRETGS